MVVWNATVECSVAREFTEVLVCLINACHAVNGLVLGSGRIDW